MTDPPTAAGNVELCLAVDFEAGRVDFPDGLPAGVVLTADRHSVELRRIFPDPVPEMLAQAIHRLAVTVAESAL